MMMQAIRDALRKPADGENREMGYLHKIECCNKKTFFYLRTATRFVKLLNSSPQSVKIIFFTPDLAGLQFGCDIKAVEFPAVFVYIDKPDSKTKNRRRNSLARIRTEIVRSGSITAI